MINHMGRPALIRDTDFFNTIVDEMFTGQLTIDIGQYESIGW